MNAIDIIKAVGAFLATLIGSYLIYGIKTLGNRLNRLESEISAQKVINGKFEEYKVYKDQKDAELKELLDEIKGDIKSLTAMVNEIKIELAGLR